MGEGSTIGVTSTRLGWQPQLWRDMGSKRAHAGEKEGEGPARTLRRVVDKEVVQTESRPCP